MIKDRGKNKMNKNDTIKMLSLDEIETIVEYINNNFSEDKSDCEQLKNYKKLFNFCNQSMVFVINF